MSKVLYLIMQLRLIVLFCGVLMSSVLVAQTDGILSPEGRECLNQIYHPRQEQRQYDLKASEYLYLTAYRYFIEFISFEQDSSATHFMDVYERVSDIRSAQKNQTTQLMLVNLSIQKGLIQWMRNEQFAGTFSFINGHRLLKENFSKPSLQPEVKKLRALYLILIYQLPDYVMNGANLFGFQGDRSEGFRELQAYLMHCEGKEGIYSEALVLYGYCLLKFSSHDNDQMDPFINKARLNESPLLTFVSASVSIKKRDGVTTRVLLDELQPEMFGHFPLLYHLKGKTELNNLTDECEASLTRFLNHYPGMSFKADAHLRLASLYRLRNDSCKMSEQMDMLQAMDAYPTSSDKQSLRESYELKNKPVVLIKARLLFDDGQTNDCIKLLETIDHFLLSDFYRAEWHYRLARALEAEKRYKDAVYHYEQVLPLTRVDDRYLGPYSALNAAKIYLEILSDSTSCKKMLQRAKELNTGQYKSDIKRKISELVSKLEQ